MTSFLQFALALAILITAAKAGGYISLRLGQPSVLGELLVGLLLGPSLVDLLHLSYFSNEHLALTIHEMAELGVLMLMFLAGLELNLSDLAETGKTAAFAGTLGVVVPLGLGLGVGLLFDMSFTSALFLGLILAATSVSISAQTLMELGVLRSRVGLSLLGAAVFDDILVVLGLSIFTALTSSGGGSLLTVALIAGRMMVFLGGGMVLGMRLLPALSRRVARLPISQGLLAFVVVVMLLYGWTAEMLGSMAAITGAFMAGLIFSRSPVKERIESGMAALAYGLFVPVFFINVGLTANLRELTGPTLWIFLVTVITAIIGKIFGAGLGGLWGGLSRLEALQLGIGMVSRGEVGLIVAAVGLNEGLISAQVFSALVGVIILTTLLTPPMLRTAFRKPRAAPESEAA